MFNNLQAIILAAGKSARFNTGKTKLAEKMCGQEIVIYPLTVLAHLKIPSSIVIGCHQDQIRTIVEKYYPEQFTYAFQETLEGTLSALQASASLWNAENILVLNADMPLITSALIEELYAHHREKNATISFVSAYSEDPSGFPYGRVTTINNKLRIIDPYELSRQELMHHSWINSGIMIIKREFLANAIGHAQPNKNTHELHMSSLINIAADHDCLVSTITASFDIIRDINTYQDLWAVEQIQRAELIRYWMSHGVRFSIPQSNHIDLNVEIGAGTYIGAGAHLLAGTRVGSNCLIAPFTILDDATIGNASKVHAHTIVTASTLHDHVEVGPFAHIQHTTVGHETHLGNFVEVKRSTIGSHSRAKHLTYLGDAQVGSHVNIGAGTITCNYDGKHKKKTIIHDHAFIGSNNSLIAPVTVHEHAFTAAGSTITHDVPAHALAIARARQVNKPDYVKIKKEQSAQEKTEAHEPPLSFLGAFRTNNEPTHNT